MSIMFPWNLELCFLFLLLFVFWLKCMCVCVYIFIYFIIHEGTKDEKWKIGVIVASAMFIILGMILVYYFSCHKRKNYQGKINILWLPLEYIKMSRKLVSVLIWSYGISEKICYSHNVILSWKIIVRIVVLWEWSLYGIESVVWY